eukprot:2049374-Alexandrium_andersonii.AAC.1
MANASIVAGHRVRALASLAAAWATSQVARLPTAPGGHPTPRSSSTQVAASAAERVAGSGAAASTG